MSLLPAGHSFQAHPDTGITALGAFDDNYIWLLANDKLAVVIDPGQAQPVLAALAQRKLELTTILLTHHHQDHVGGVEQLVQATGAKVFGPAAEVLPLCDQPLSEGMQVTDDHLALNLSVLDVPGHTAGHIAYAGTFRGHPVLFCGDTLFAAGCGRLFEGTPTQMVASLSKLAALPAQTKIYCAHEYTLSNMRWALTVDPTNQALQDWCLTAQRQREQHQPTLPSTLEQELACNPFMRVQQESVARAATHWAQRKLTTPIEVFAALREWKNSFR